MVGVVDYKIKELSERSDIMYSIIEFRRSIFVLPFKVQFQ